MVAAITDTFSCFSSLCLSIWLPFLSYASFTYLIIAKNWLNLLYWYPWLLWPSSLYYSFLSLVSRDSIWFWSAEVGPLMNKSLESSVEAITHFLRVFVTIVAIPFVDLNIPGIYLYTFLTKYLLMRWAGKGISTVDSKCHKKYQKSEILLGKLYFCLSKSVMLYNFHFFFSVWNIRQNTSGKNHGNTPFRPNLWPQIW